MHSLPSKTAFFRTFCARVRGPRSRIAWALTAIVLSLAVTAALGSVASAAPSGDGPDQPVVAEVVTDKAIQVDPGEVATAVFRLRNDSDRERPVRLALDLPTGWSVITRLSDVSIPASSVITRLVSVSVPPRASRGQYEIGLRVVDVAATSSSESSGAPVASAAVMVGVVRKIQLQVLNAPRTVQAGARFDTEFAISSRSNVPVEVDLRARSNRLFPVDTRPRQVRLQPGETVPVVVSTTTERSPSSFQHRLLLQAHLRGEKGTGNAASSVEARTEVVPVHGSAVGDRPTYPLVARLQTVGDATQTGQIVEVEGEGAVSGDDAHRVEVLARVPTEQQISGFGRRDRFEASYAGPVLEARVGDQVYGRTPLTERGRLGRGAGADVQVGRWTVGGYGLRTRYGRPDEQYGASLGASFGSVDLVSAVVQNQGGTEGTVGSMQATVPVWQDARLTGEVAAGRGPAGDGVSYRGMLEGEHRWGSYHIRHLQADADIPSTTRDVQQTSARAVVRAGQQVTFDAVYRYNRRGWGTWTALESRSRYGRAGARWSSTAGDTGWGASLYAVNRLFGFTERSYAEGEVSARRGRVSARVKGRAGRVTVPGSVGPYRGLDARLSFRTGAVSVSGGASAVQSVQPFTGEQVSGVDLQASSGIRFSKQTALYLDGQWTDVRDDRGYQVASMRFEHTFPFGHILSADARRSWFSARGAGPWDEVPTYRVSYAVPVGVPVARESSTGGVRGRVVDTETGAGVERALVRLGGEERFTDEEGRFTLPASAARGTYLYVDRASIGLSRVPMVDVPVDVRRATREEPILIPVARSAELVAQVIRYEHENLKAAVEGREPVATGGLEQTVVEVRSGSRRHRRLTDGSGHGHFGDLQPGTWTVDVPGDALGDGFELEKDAYEIDLSPGSVDTLTIRVVPSPTTGRAMGSGEAGGASGNDVLSLSSTSESSSRRTLSLSSAKSDDAASPSAEPAGTGRHVVQEDEWLAVLARRYYNDLNMWPRIWLANRDRLSNPDSVEVGVALRIPTPDDLSNDRPDIVNRLLQQHRNGGRSADRTAGDGGTSRTHRVESAEWLARLSRTYYGTLYCWPVIWDANREILESPDRVQPGTVLKIPPASQCKYAGKNGEGY